MSSPIIDVDVGKNVIATLAVMKKIPINPVGLHLLVKALETKEMVLGSLDRVGDGGAGLHDKGPVTRLGQEQLATSLLHRPFRHPVLMAALADDFGHAPRRRVK